MEKILQLRVNGNCEKNINILAALCQVTSYAYLKAIVYIHFTTIFKDYNTMKHYIILLLGTLIFLSSCRKESSIIIDEIDTTEETELEATVFSGQISDREENGLQASIDIYQNENLIGKVTTDTEGKYITDDLFIEPNEEVTLDIYSVGFKNKYRRFSKDIGLHQDLNYTLVSNEDAVGAPVQFLENPGSKELIKVHKTLTDVYGQPVPNIFNSVSYDIEQISPNWYNSKGGFDISDENGYIEVLVPAGEEYFHSAAQFIDDTNIDCYNNYYNSDTTLFSNYFTQQYLGIITEDYEITDYPEIAIHPTSYSIDGTLLNCDNTPLTSGFATLRITYGEGTFPNVQSFPISNFDAEGNFQVDFDICNYGEYFGFIRGVGDDGQIVEYEFVGNLGETTIPTLTTCGTVVLDSSYMNLQIGNLITFNDINFPQNASTNSNISASGFHPDHGNIILYLIHIGLGDNSITLLNLNFIDENPYGFRSEAELNLNITSIENGYITGTISGSTETNELGTQEITGELYIKYQ